MENQNKEDTLPKWIIKNLLMTLSKGNAPPRWVTHEKEPVRRKKKKKQRGEETVKSDRYFFLKFSWGREPLKGKK